MAAVVVLHSLASGFLRARGALMVVLVLVLLALVACRSNGGRASNARIARKEAATLQIVFGAKQAELPSRDLVVEARAPIEDPPAVLEDDTGRRLAYRTSAG